MLLHKPQVYRHLLFNRITEQDGVEVRDTEHKLLTVSNMLLKKKIAARI